MRDRTRAYVLGERGFTLAELMTSLSVFGVVAAAIVSIMINTFSSAGYQTRLLDAQLDASTAMALLRNDFLGAGYIIDGMNQNIFQAVTTGTTSDTVSIAGDVNSDGVTERVTYAVVNGQLLRTQDQWSGGSWTAGTAQPVANSVTAFTMQFYRSCAFAPVFAPTPQPTPAPPALQSATEVEAGRTSLVRITLTTTATYKGQTVSKTLTTEVAERQDNVRPQC